MIPKGYTPWCVADLINELSKMHPAMPIAMWNPEWIKAYSIAGLDIVDGKVYIHTGQSPDREGPDGELVPVEE